MNKRFLLFLLIIGLCMVKGFACDCVYGGPFLQMAKRTPLVALIKVTKYLTFKDIDDSKTPMSMEVEIVDTYKGKENRKTITVWGDIGNLCRPYLSTFKEGQYYVIAFDKGSHSSGHAAEKDTDYSITHCGCYWLTADMEKRAAIGDINSDDRRSTTINLKNLKGNLQKTAVNKRVVSRRRTEAATIYPL